MNAKNVKREARHLKN